MTRYARTTGLILPTLEPWRRPSEDRWTDDDLRAAVKARAAGDTTPGTLAAVRAYRRIMARRRRDQGPCTVPTTDVLAHIKWLQRCGLSLACISEASGATQSLVYGLVTPTARDYRTTVLASTRTALLAVRPDPRGLPARRYTGAIGTQRRVRAAACMGWSSIDVAARLGVAKQELARYTERRIECGNAARIADLYDSLSMRVGPSVQARAYATQRGWAPPLAWDDDTIDDPDATPNIGVKDAGIDLGEVEWLARQGYSDDAIAERLQVTPGAVWRNLQRHPEHAHIGPIMRRNRRGAA